MQPDSFVVPYKVHREGVFISYRRNRANTIMAKFAASALCILLEQAAPAAVNVL
jgi:hypothetical protein